MKYTLFVIDGGFVDDDTNTITIKGVLESDLQFLIKLFTSGENDFDVVVRRSEKE